MAAITSPQRRLDRSLDKPEFKLLPQQDRSLVYQLRNAMEGVHNKVEALKDDIDDREREISREQALRKAAEERLDKLVDMYGNPAVNEELKERLPRAAKTNNTVKWQKELDGLNSLRRGRAASTDSLDFLEEDEVRSSKSRSKSADGRRRARGRRYDSDGESEAEPHSRRSGHPPFASPWDYRAPTATQYAVPPYPAYYPPPAVVLHPQVLLGAAATQQPGVVPQTNAQPQAQQLSGTADAETETSTEANKTGPSALIASVHAEIEEKAKVKELNRRVAMLLTELDAAKDLSEKLQTKLSEAEKRVEEAKIQQQIQQAEMEAQHTGKITALVEEIYAAQKQRDEAMLNRLRTANGERDEALLKLQHLQDNLDELDVENMTEGADMAGLLQGLRQAVTCEEIGTGGKALVNALNSALRRHRQSSAEEMRAVLQDRDNALSQSKKFEGEMLRLQRQMKDRDNQQDEHHVMQTKLLATQQERDIMLAKCEKLEEEVQTLQVYYSLHKSLSQEASLRDQFNTTVETLEEQVRERDDAVDHAQRENSRLAQQLQDAARDKLQLLDQLHVAQEAQKHAMANEHKLERLVNVLRRKIKGLGPNED